MLTPTGAGLCWAAVGAISVDFQRMTTGVIGPRRRMRHGSAYGKQPLVQGLACHSFDQVQLLSQTTRRQIVVRTRRYPLVCPFGILEALGGAAKGRHDRAMACGRGPGLARGSASEVAADNRTGFVDSLEGGRRR